MSLATAGGGLGGVGGGGVGGLTMAHQANAMARPAAPTPPQGSALPPGMAPPSSSAAALGADLVDKSQQISLKQVKDLSKFPIVAIDLYGNEPHLAYFAPKPKDDPAAAAGMTPTMVGKMKDKLALQANENSHKVFRKWLSKSKDYQDLQNNVLAKTDDPSAVLLESPQKWLGLRRLDDAPDFLKNTVAVDESSNTPAIAEESTQGVGVAMANGTLDGSAPQGDDFDRVVCKVRLNPAKKALTVLPEEVLQLVLNQAQYHVARTMKAKDENEDITSYPCSISVPSVYCTDHAMEALLDATEGTGVIFQRGVAALAGALLPGNVEGQHNQLILQTNKKLQQIRDDYKIQQVKDPEAKYEESMVVLLCGITSDTVECTAIQISTLQPERISCVYGNYKVLSNVAYRHPDPETIIDKSVSETFDSLDDVAPEADGPIAFVSYGTPAEQKLIQSKWDKLKQRLEDWEDIPHVYTKPDAVAMGTAVLGAVSHGRLSKLVELPGKKPKAAMALEVQNVAPVAAGIRFNYHGGEEGKWLPVKTIFDFDRRVPAGPYDIDLNAAECAVHRSGKSGEMSEEQLVKAIKDKEGSASIPIREEAALNLRYQIVQKASRDGEWRKVGNVQSPLVLVDRDDNKTACERITLQLSLGNTGLLTSSEVGERETVVQATRSARNSKIQWYLGVLAAILFFGGFLVKSWWEEFVFDRDTRRLLAYYKNVVPGSMSDGDEHNARYLVWKYRGKKEKLWKSLEKKYGEPVLQEHEWPEPLEEEVADDTPEDLDGSETKDQEL